MDNTISRIGKLFREIVENSETGDYWKNIPLAREAFDLMKALPPVVEGEFATPAEKGGLLDQMLDHIHETLTPRLSLEVRRYIHELDPENAHNIKEIERLEDFVNLDFPMPDYCRKHRVHLQFDPVERTEKWEEVIYDVEKALAKRFKGVSPHMGFCFRYWPAKGEELARRGIRWKNPHLMNPHVMFD